MYKYAYYCDNNGNYPKWANALQINVMPVFIIEPPTAILMPYFNSNIHSIWIVFYVLYFEFQSVSKFIRKTQRLDHQNIWRNILCSPIQIIAVNGIDGWMNFDQCQNWISISINIINHHHRGRIQSNDRQKLWKAIHSHLFSPTSILTPTNAFD